jgi:hypothetical protein
MEVAPGGESLEGLAIELRTSLRKRLRNMGSHSAKKSAPRLVPPGFIQVW